MCQRMHGEIEFWNKTEHPNTFLTVVFNQKCHEIQRCLLSRPSPQDLLKVFDLNLKALMEEIIMDTGFGQVMSPVRVIHFQNEDYHMRTASLYSTKPRRIYLEIQRE